jgi:hypothetical protein
MRHPIALVAALSCATAHIGQRHIGQSPNSNNVAAIVDPLQLQPTAIVQCIDPDPSEQFLLYIGLNRGFSNQWLTLLENIVIAQASNRTLVLSGFRGASLDPNAKYFDGYFIPNARRLDFSDFFSKSVFRRSVKTIDLAEFEALCQTDSTAIVQAFPKRWYGEQYGNISTEENLGDVWAVEEMIFSNVSTAAVELQHVRRIIHPDPTVLPLGYFKSFNDTVMVTDDLYYNVESSAWLQAQHRRLVSSSFRWAENVAARAKAFIATQMPARSVLVASCHQT